MKKISIICLAVAASLVFGACKKKPENGEGPLESSGEEAASDVREGVDEAAEDTGEAVEEAGEETKDALD